MPEVLNDQTGAALRLFIAATFDDAIREHLAAEARRFEAPTPELARAIRWTAPENIHLTVKFLGTAPAAGVTSIIDVVRSAAETERRSCGRVSGVGSFAARQGPSVIWAAINEGKALAGLAGKLDSSLEKLGYPRERRPYFAHVTLARARSRQAARLVLKHLEQLPFDLNIPIDTLVLYQSELRPHGPVYSPLAQFTLEQV